VLKETEVKMQVQEIRRIIATLEARIQELQSIGRPAESK
jgi:hypothetical protein